VWISQSLSYIFYVWRLFEINYYVVAYNYPIIYKKGLLVQAIMII